MKSISNLITRIKNKNTKKNNYIFLSLNKINKMTKNIITILVQEGFIFIHKDHNNKGYILNLKYNNFNIKQISHSGRQIYSNYKKIPRVLEGMGIIIISTSKGLMTDQKAKLEKIGGEILCYIW
uniref:Small ribosomal subunit protein uS8c n=1 Tax=Mitrastemon kanehirai TaxID=1358725 RepID=A0A4Y1MD58_9ERIC|nr:ribosomal protein S8 [Mitrastemon kanehirai]